LQAVFFDLFQTLIYYDPSREEIIAGALREYGISVEPALLTRPLEAADQFMYRELVVRPMGIRPANERIALYLKHHELMFDKAGLTVEPSIIPNIVKRLQEATTSYKLFDDTLPALKELKALGMILGLISNMDSDMSEQLDKMGIGAFLDVVMTSRIADAMKPSREIFEAALNKAGVKANEAVYVGDQYEIDVKGAREAGMRAILIDRTDAHPEIVDCPRIRSLTEIKNYL